MSTVRPLRREDIPQVAKLRRRSFRHTRITSDAALEQYLEELFFANPWHDERLPSLVAVTTDGCVEGVAGVVPRPFIYEGHSVLAAVFTQFMVAEESRGKGIGRLLVRQFLDGPQDLSITDVANDSCRHVWERCGGFPAWPYSMQWTRVIRLRARLGELVAHESRYLRYAAMPCFGLLGIASGLLRKHQVTWGHVDTKVSEISPAELANSVAPVLQQFRLAPRYAAKDFAWLGDRLENETGKRMYCCKMVDDAGEAIGSYVYLLDPQGYSEVLHVAAVVGYGQDVVASLLKHAEAKGAVALRGQMQPWIAAELSEQGCNLRRSGPWTLVHARRPDLMQSILAGQAFLSRLDGEWWIGC